MSCLRPACLDQSPGHLLGSDRFAEGELEQPHYRGQHRCPNDFTFDLAGLPGGKGSRCRVNVEVRAVGIIPGTYLVETRGEASPGKALFRDRLRILLDSKATDGE